MLCCVLSTFFLHLDKKRERKKIENKRNNESNEMGLIEMKKRKIRKEKKNVFFSIFS